MLWVAVAVVILVVLLVAIVVGLDLFHASSSPGSGNSNPPGSGTTIVTSGTQWQVAGGHYWDRSFVLPERGIVTGNWTASSKIRCDIMNASGFAAWVNGSRDGPGQGFLDVNLTSWEMGTILGPGTYYLVFDNTWSSTATTVQATSTLQWALAPD
jgi:hypothetical protein